MTAKFSGEGVISSRANPLFKSLHKIAHSARERRKSGKTLLDGVHLIDAYRAALGEPEMLIAAPTRLARAEIRAVFSRYGNAKRILMEEALFDELSPVETPSGVLALITRRSPEIKKRASAVLLEAIQDPGNLGTLLRSAAAAGFTHALLSSSCADAWAPKTLRAGMGAHFVLAIDEHVDLLRHLHDASGPVFALSVDGGQNLYECDLTGDVALLFGNEGAGLSAELEALATQRVFIPMAGAIESLNVAAAASICCFEKLRQDQRIGLARSRRA